MLKQIQWLFAKGLITSTRHSDARCSVDCLTVCSLYYSSYIRALPIVDADCIVDRTSVTATETVNGSLLKEP